MARFFDREYLGTPVWEIEAPQPEVVRLEAEGEILGRVLDVGCGTALNSIHLADAGHEVVGVDIAPNAIRRAEARRPSGSENPRFVVASALELPDLGGPFDTVLDSGVFHTFLDPHRPLYSTALHRTLVPGGRLFVLVFSEEEPTDWGGPRRVSREELRATFADGWRERWIRPARYSVRLPGVAGRAWLAAFDRSHGAG